MTNTDIPQNESEKLTSPDEGYVISDSAFSPEHESSEVVSTVKVVNKDYLVLVARGEITCLALADPKGTHKKNEKSVGTEFHLEVELVAPEEGFVVRDTVENLQEISQKNSTRERITAVRTSKSPLTIDELNSLLKKEKSAGKYIGSKTKGFTDHDDNVIVKSQIETQFEDEIFDLNKEAVIETYNIRLHKLPKSPSTVWFVNWTALTVTVVLAMATFFAYRYKWVQRAWKRINQFLAN